MSKLVIATRNEHKAQEIAAILRDAPVELATLAEFPEAPEVEETGDTLEANALLKARAAAEAAGLAAAADDTGLFVDALDGRPGIYAARYAGPEASYEAKNKKMLEELAGVPEQERTARFECVVALVVPGKAPFFFKGAVPGRIIEAPRGENGFGYDPIFQPDDMDGTMAELSPQAKNAVSHRCIAFRRLADFLKAAKGKI